jgi:hypothetical protein
MKKCCRCRECKPLDAFYRASKSPDGRQAACIACQKVRSQAYIKGWRELGRAAREMNRLRTELVPRVYVPRVVRGGLLLAGYAP